MMSEWTMTFEDRTTGARRTEWVEAQDKVAAEHLAREQLRFAWDDDDEEEPPDEPDWQLASVVDARGERTVIPLGRGAVRVSDAKPAAPAPAPLTVIPPRRVASPPLDHPYRGTPQYGQAREADPARPHARRADEPYLIERAYGTRDRDGFGSGVSAALREKAERGNAGYAVEATGRTGAPVGRPRIGTSVPADAERLLVEHCPEVSIAELSGCLRRGKPSAGVRRTRVALGDAVRTILHGRMATREALAGALGCNVRTIDRLRDRAPG
jgi:hypothetical protein